MADILGCEKENVYEEIEKVLDQLISRKPLREYGMTEEQIDTFTDSTLENQQRLRLIIMFRWIGARSMKYLRSCGKYVKIIRY